MMYHAQHVQPDAHDVEQVLRGNHLLSVCGTATPKHLLDTCRIGVAVVQAGSPCRGLVGTDSCIPHERCVRHGEAPLLGCVVGPHAKLQSKVAQEAMRAISSSSLEAAV